MADFRPFTEAWPGGDLAFRVTGSVDREWFYQSGLRSIHDIEAVLGIVDRSLSSFTSILDFGCGCGRMLIWLGEIAKSAMVHGVDIDAQAVNWVQQHLSFATVKHSEPLPPLDYDDGFFDLIYNHSVFSHLDENFQDQWLTELRRITRPGGWVVLSVHGEHAFNEFVRTTHVSEEARIELGKRGILFLSEDGWTHWDANPYPDFFHTTFHAPWYIFAHWSRWFRIRAYVPIGSLGYQDFVLLERLPDDAPHETALSPSAR